MEKDWFFYVISVIVIVAVTFSFMEAYAIRTNQATLSRTVWELNKSWPPLGWLVGITVGLLVGFLAAHFFWPGEGCLIGPLPK